MSDKKEKPETSNEGSKTKKSEKTKEGSKTKETSKAENSSKNATETAKKSDKSKEGSKTKETSKAEDSSKNATEKVKKSKEGSKTKETSKADESSKNATEKAKKSENSKEGSKTKDTSKAEESSKNANETNKTKDFVSDWVEEHAVENADDKKSVKSSKSTKPADENKERLNSDGLELRGDNILEQKKVKRDKDNIALISLAVKYLYKTSKLQIDVRKCWDLVPYGQDWTRVDPYVKIYLMPDQSRASKRKSQIMRNDFNPVFNKKLEYEIPKSELETRSLYVSLWHSNLLGRNIFLGEVIIPLDFRDESLAHPKTYQLKRKPKNPLLDDSSEDESDSKSTITDITTGKSALRSVVGSDSGRSMKSSVSKVTRKNPLMLAVMYCGDVYMSIKFVPENSVLVIWDRDLESKGEFHVHIKKGMNLTGFGDAGETNALCKLNIIRGQQILRKHKTTIVHNNSSPEWDSRKRFENFGEMDLHDVELDVQVWNKVGMTSKLIGKASVFITGEVYDWTRARCLKDNTLYVDEILNQANTWIDVLVPLRINEITT